MGRRILIIDGHPDPDRGRLIHALADAYGESAVAAGHQVRRIDLAAMDVPFLRTKADFENGDPPAAAAQAQQDIAWCEHIVLLFPLWMGAEPALVKAFLEQVLRPGFAAEGRANGMPVKRLKGRSVRIVVTMGMPVLAYRWWFWAHGLKSLRGSILTLVGFAPIRETLFGRVEDADPEIRSSWLRQLRALGRSGD